MGFKIYKFNSELYIVVTHSVVDIYLNKRHGEMRLKQKMITDIVNVYNLHAVLDHEVSIFNSAIYYNVKVSNSDNLKHVR